VESGRLYPPVEQTVAEQVFELEHLIAACRRESRR
jgi:hypothetical protein